jgi:hypothetical protein
VSATKEPRFEATRLALRDTSVVQEVTVGYQRWSLRPDGFDDLRCLACGARVRALAALAWTRPRDVEGQCEACGLFSAFTPT